MSSIEPNHYFAEDEVKRSVHGGGRLATFTIALEAWRRGLTVTFLDALPFEYELSDGVKTIRFDRALPGATTREAFRACNNKSRALHLMEIAGVSVPRGRRIDASSTTMEEVVQTAHEIGYPVVIKPVLGSMGRGVFSGIRSDEDLKNYYRYIVDELKKNRIIIEKHIDGQDYRVFVVGETVAAATWRSPASVVGNGQQSVTELIYDKNYYRRNNPALSKELITIDLEVERQLRDQGLTYDSVPAAGQYVRLRGKANLSTGGEIVDVTQLLPDMVKQVAIDAVAAIPGLVSAGVDVMIDKKPAELDVASIASVIELNPRAHIGGHMFPSDGPGHNAAGALVDHFFPDAPKLDSITAGRISFDIDDVLRPIRLGVVKSATLAPLPSHRYPYRRVLTFSGLSTLPRGTRDLISRKSRAWSISGSLRTSEHSLELCVAGEQSDVEAFLGVVTEAVGRPPDDLGEWSSVVWMGFKVDVRTVG